MSALEKLSPIISVCQVCGMLPFSMEYDPATKEFTKFAFSFRHFITWWYILIILLHLVAFPYVLGNLAGNLLRELSSDRSIPVTVSIVASVTSVGFLAQLLVCRWIVFRHYRRLRNAVEAVKAVQRILQSSSAGYKNSTSKIVAIGIILLLVAVSTKKHTYASYIR